MTSIRLPKILSKVIICLLLVITACQENTVYHSYQPVNNAGWLRNDTFSFFLDSCLIPNISYDYLVGIRHKDSYAYQDIWLGITPLLKDSISVLKTDTLHLYLSDSTGVWKGKGLGELRQFTSEETITLTPADTDTIIGFRLIHLMQDQPLKGIQDAGLCIQKRP